MIVACLELNYDLLGSVSHDRGWRVGMPETEGHEGVSDNPILPAACTSRTSLKPENGASERTVR